MVKHDRGGHYGGTRNDKIYYILKPVLLVSKYAGIFPLNDVYEQPFDWMDRSVRRILFDKAVPIVAILWLSFVGKQRSS